MTQNKQKTAVITGVTGQTGSFIAELLLKKGYKVIGMKRRTSLLDAHKRIEHIFNHPNFKLVYGNMSDGGSLWRLINEFKPDECYNMAAQSHVKVSFEVSEETLDVVAMGPLRLLNAIREISPKTRFYQAGSSEQWGIATCPKTGFDETSPMIPASPYGAAKIFAYNIVKNYREAYGLFAVTGLLNNHESNRRGETFVTRKVTMAAAKIKLGLQNRLFLGNLDAYRDWSHAMDMAEGIILMLQQPKPQDYVLASGETHTVKEMVEYVFEELANLNYQRYVEIDPRLKRPQEVPYLLGNSTKARTELEWQPKYTFKDLLKEMYLYDLEMIAKENGMDYTKYVAGNIIKK